VIGVIDSEHSSKNFYTDRHLQILTSIASQCADKINKARVGQQVRDRELELVTLKHHLAASRLTALRAQMNPHFIFNALNSIQQFVLQGNVDEANKYLSKFSRLQREVLNHCDQDFITLEKEIEMLRLYLELEQLRFNGNFKSFITLAEDLDSNEIRIPPMLLQPFVENAIWHGLMPKTSCRRLNIDFSVCGDELLVCTIRDNGIGRAAAARLKMSHEGGASHKSKGLSLVFERMNILHQQYQQRFDVDITDITDEEKNIQGTQVKLTLYIGQ
jgi:LytS/YehU family sensor histidine kinase